MDNKITYVPELGDVVRVILYPNNFFTYLASNPTKDISIRIFNEYLGTFKSTVYPIGKIVEIFKHKKANTVWAGVHNRVNGVVYNVPIKNILEQVL